MHPVNQLPTFVTNGLYRRYLRPGEIVVILTGRGNAGMLFQAASGFYFRIAGGYINASLTPTYALPNQVIQYIHPGKAAIRKFDYYARSAGDRRARRRAHLGAGRGCGSSPQAGHARHLSGRRDHLPNGPVAR